jgi:predicted metal-dependent peptidase
MNVPDRIKRAHIAIMQHKKFCAFSGVLACGKVIFSEDIPSACTNGWDRIYNPKFIEEHMPTDPELRFLVLHEATHVAYRHLTTWRALHEENARLANIAADFFVNLTLHDTDDGEGFIKMPAIGVPVEPKYRGWSVNMIYADLKKQQEEQKANGQGDENGDGSGMDEHDWDGNEANGDPAKEQEQANEIQRAIRQGEIMRKKLAGKGAGGDDGVFGDLMAPKIDWKKVLREFITETCAGRDESSWSRPNRRYLGMDVYMPTMLGTTMTELVIGFDTSGSIFGGNEMTRFVSEIKTIIEDVKPSRHSRTASSLSKNSRSKAVAAQTVLCCSTTCVTSTSTLKPSCSSLTAMSVAGAALTCLRCGPSHRTWWHRSAHPSRWKYE